MTGWPRRFGFALALAAYGALAFHVEHADANHSSPAHHCCPCHAHSANPNLPAAAVAPAAKFEARPKTAAFSVPRQPLLLDNAPRGPPAA
ncbi:MAG: hypothetical protein HY554_14160 [Elusimicrobia bacterium]|nr:hypothetical protein [Elusimicrobiota bacterium]